MVNPDRRIAAQLAARARFVEAANGRRTRKVPPREAPPVALGDTFDRKLVALLAPLGEHVQRIIDPALHALVSVAPLPRSDAARWRFDGPADDIIRRVIHDIEVAVGRQIPAAEIERLAHEIGLDVSSHNREAVNRQFRQVLGIDLPSSDPFLAAQLDLFRSSAVKLITNAVKSQVDKIEHVLTNAARTGSRVEDIRNQIVASGLDAGRFRSVETRASLIARDQVLKLNSELTQLRHREAGVEEYEWSSSNDERVRGNPGGLWPEPPRGGGNHWHLDSRRSHKTYRWDQPPVVDTRTGRRAHPGEDYQCRCVAIPVIDLAKIGRR